MLLDGAQNHARLFGEEFEGAVDGEIVSWAVHEWVVGEGRGALQALLVDFEAEKLEHLSHGGSGVHAQALEEKNLQRNDLRELKVCGDVLQPAAAHALGPGLEAALLARAQPTDQRHVPAPAPTPSLRVEPPLELGPKRADNARQLNMGGEKWGVGQGGEEKETGNKKRTGGGIERNKRRLRMGLD